MAHPSDTTAIEERLARDRAAFASTLENIQDRMSAEHLAHEALGMVRSNAKAYTRSIDRAVRANPLALALTGVGLVWLIFGGNRSSDDGGEESERQTGTSGAAQEAGAGREALPGFEEWARQIDGMRDRASRRLQDMERGAAEQARALRDGIRDEFDTLHDFAAERAAVLADFTASMKASLADGLEGLSEEARDRIVAARKRAYAAMVRARRAAATGTREAGRMVEDHPLVAGLCAAALGAAFAAALPRTRAEDRAFGAERDRLLAEAARLLETERRRAERVASGMADELRDGAMATVDAVTEKLGETGQAMRDRARQEAAAEPAAGKAGAAKASKKHGRKKK